jgi:hypothetical protein
LAAYRSRGGYRAVMGDTMNPHVPTHVAVLHRPWRRVLLIALGLLLVAGLAVSGWTWRHAPSPFDGYGGGERGVAKPGEAMMIGIINSPLVHTAPEVILESATPILAHTVRGARVWVVACVNPYHGRAHVGSDRALPRARCEHVHPVAGTRILVGQGTPTDIVVVIQSPRPGLVVVNGVRLRYTDGWRHGEQVLGDHIRMRYRTDAPW